MSSLLVENENPPIILVAMSLKRVTQTEIVCIHNDHPDKFIPKDGSRQILNILNNLIDSEPDERTEIKIQYIKAMDGGLEVGCANEVSAIWVKAQHKNLEEGTNFKLKFTDRMVLPFILATVRVDFDEGQPFGVTENNNFNDNCKKKNTEKGFETK